jgi:hypothetical protein
MFAFLKKLPKYLNIVTALIALGTAVGNRLKQIFSGSDVIPENAKENEDGSDTTNLPQ